MKYQLDIKDWAFNASKSSKKRKKYQVGYNCVNLKREENING